MKPPFKGKAIYNPTGKAGEYSSWACNFYNGCSNDCSYCYCKRGVMSSVWSTTPTLKKCFRDEEYAIEVFLCEMMKNKEELQKNGLFFSFTTDPLLDETCSLTVNAMTIAFAAEIPVIVLTKMASFVDTLIPYLQEECSFRKNWKDRFIFGFTLTGHDELEQGADRNKQRIKAMKKLHDAGFKTWASIEPIVDIDSSAKMILETAGVCDLYKVGLMSGKKYAWQDLRGLMLLCAGQNSKFYFKDSFVEQSGMNRANLPENCVGRDYKLFN